MEFKEPATQAEIHDLIENNLFDASKISNTLENYVDEQVKTGTYDFKANRHLLQLFNLAPNKADTTDEERKVTARKTDVVEKILLLALAQLPLPHFLACTYLVHGKMHDLESVKLLTHLHTCIEAGNFPKFWTQLSDPKTKALVGKLPQFEDALRSFVASTLADVYQGISVDDLKSFLNIQDNDTLSKFIQAQGWTVPTEAAISAPAGKNKSKKTKGSVVAPTLSGAISVSLPLGPGNQFVAASTTEKLSLDSIAMVLETLAAHS